MMATKDRYSSRVAKLFRMLNRSKAENFAVTLSSTTTYYDCLESEVTPEHRKHEDAHKAQIKRLGWFRFMSEYIWQLGTVGYKENKFEEGI